jgi:Domain of Unknown Function (DUF1080)
MKRLLLAGSVLLAALALVGRAPWATAEDKAKPKDTGWVQLFNGKDLTGWKSHPKSPGKWEVKDGVILGRGKATSHLFSERGDYKDFYYVIEARISDKGNSGQYFRAKFAPGFPPGYEAQINSTHSDPIRTGSLYPAFNPKLSPAEREKIIVREELVKPDEWFTQMVVAKGNHIIILVNGKKTVDFVDQNNTYTKGHFAIQQHPPMKGSDESIIQVRKIAVKELPATN